MEDLLRLDSCLPCLPILMYLFNSAFLDELLKLAETEICHTAQLFFVQNGLFGTGPGDEIRFRV